MKPRDIVEAGQAAGVQFSPNLVYAVKGKGGADRARSGGRRRAVAGLAIDHEAALKKAALYVGVDRAREILDALEADMRKLLGQ